MKSLIFVSLILLVFSSAASAQPSIDPCQSYAAVSCAGMRVTICPMGDFERIANGCGGSSDYIEITLLDYSGFPMPGIPPNDFWMNSCDARYELCLCVQPFLADAATDANGRTTISGTISGGGCVPDGGLYIAAQGKVIMQQPDCLLPICLDIVIVGPDNNSDCQVNISDFAFFGDTYNKAEGETDFNTCFDFDGSGLCDLSDFSFFCSHYLH